MTTIKLRKVGNSYGFTIPKSTIEKYNLKEGSKLHIIEKKESITITPYDPEFEEWLKCFEETTKKYKNTLKALAK